MGARNNSKTSDFFDKIQTIYNSSTRGEQITKKSSIGLPSAANFTFLKDKLEVFLYYNTRDNISFVPMLLDKQFYTNLDFNNTLLNSTNLYTQINFIPSHLRSYVLENSLYNLEDSQNNKLKFKFIYKPFLKAVNNTPYTTSLPLYSEDLFSNPTNSNMLNFNIYNNEMLFDSSDDSYENLKNFQILYSPNHQNVILQSYKYLLPTTYTNILDSFRADYDDHN
jgi:hypothetical protein